MNYIPHRARAKRTLSRPHIEKRTRFGGSLLICLILSFLTGYQQVRSQELGSLDQDQISHVSENAHIAQAVYDPSVTELPGGWERIRSQVDPDGFRAAIWERTLPNGQRDIRISFAGSDDRNDWWHNIVQGLPVSLGGLVGLPYDKIAKSQFERARAFSAGYAHMMKTDKSIKSVEVVGHSRAGMFVQYVSGVFGYAGSAFNSAALNLGVGWMTFEQRHSADRNVRHFVADTDRVFSATRAVPGAQHLGQIYRVEAPVELRVDPLTDLRSGELSEKLVAGHNMGAMLRGLDAASRAAVKDNGSSGLITRRVPVSQEAVEVIIRDLSVIGKGMEHLNRMSAVKHVADPKSWGALPRNYKAKQAVAKTLSGLGAINEINSFVDAIRNDQDQYRGQSMVLMRSHLFERLSETALTGTSIPGLKELPGSKGMVKSLYEVLENNKLISHQPRVSLTRETLDIGTPTFGAINLVKAAATHAGRGYADVDTIEQYLDGLVGLTWGAVGFVRSGGNLATAERFQDAGQALAHTGRYALKKTGGDRAMLKFWDMDFRKQEDVMRAQYESAVDVAVGRGQQPISPAEYFGGKRADQAQRAQQVWRNGGGGNESFAELNDYYQAKAASIPSSPTIYDVPLGDRSLPKAAQDGRVAVDLVPRKGKVLITGTGPVAEATRRQAVQKFGRDNVKHVPVVRGSYERNRLASDFGARTVISVSQQSYRETTRRGVRTVTPIPPRQTESPASRKTPTPGLPGQTARKLHDDLENQRVRDRGRRRTDGYPDTPKQLVFPPKPPPTGLGLSDPTCPKPDLSPIRNHSFRPHQVPSSLTFERPRPGVGGVMLKGVAEAAEGSNLTAGNFSLIFEGADGEIDIPTLRRFVTALWAVYFSEEGPGISIDPINGIDDDKHAVRYIGRVINSDLGRVMRETDYIMKSWSVGTSKPGIPGFLTPDEIAGRNKVLHMGGPSRFWFVPEEFRFRQGENALLFDSGGMTLKTEYLFENKGKKDPENEEWAKSFTDRYEEIATAYPVFDELFEYAKMVALAKHLKKQGVPLLWFLMANREMVLTEDSPGTVEAFAKRSDFFEGVEIYGGVDLSPGIADGGFVIDEDLAKEIAKAKKQAPSRPSGTSGPEVEQVEVIQTEKDSFSVAPLHTVVISESGPGEDGYATDLGLRVEGAPHLEVTRYRRTDFPKVHTFGRDWHLMIPYSIAAGPGEKVPVGGMMLPETMILRNLLSGREETFRLDEDKFDIVGYLPEEGASSLNVGIFPMTDQTFRMEDRLGCHFEFDAQGRLSRMLLAERLEYEKDEKGKITGVNREASYDVRYEYGSKRFTWRDYKILPFRLAPDGTEHVAVGNGVKFSRQLRLFDAATGREELFTYDEEDALEFKGYVPSDREASAYHSIAILSDGSLQLEHGSGSLISFDRGGRFTSMAIDTVEKMHQGPYEVTFDYELAASDYRIGVARVVDRKSGKPIHAVVYKYARGGGIADTSLISATK